MYPNIQYAKSGDVFIAYQSFGEGPRNVVVAPGFISNIEWYWDDPRASAWLQGLTRLGRVTIFDKRGTGLSDRVGDLPSMDVRMDDMRAVIDAAGIDRAVIMGISEGGSLATLFAAHHQARCEALVLYGAFARFSSWFPTEEAFQYFLGYIQTAWGNGGIGPLVAPTLANDAAFLRSVGKFERQGGSPAAVVALMQMNSQINIVDVLASIHVPTLVIHKTEDAMVSVEGGRELANGIPGAQLFEMPGTDHLPWYDDCQTYIAEMEEFVTGTRSDPVIDRVLATVLFTDIVDSTVRVGRMGDTAWRALLDEHDQVFRKQLQKFRGHEIKSLGDGFMATFDGPARAIKCAQNVCAEVKALGLEVRAGLHTGELEMTEHDARGICVHIASRVAAMSEGSKVLVTRTVKDLVAGSGILFTDYGDHALKGIPDKWQLYLAQ
jgi:pimeloyl-ACP methyl ester carboxylesterase